MRTRRFRLMVIGAVAAVTVVLPASPALAICNGPDPITEKVVCGAYYRVGDLMCKLHLGCPT